MTLPTNPEAERSLLGAVLLNPSLLSACITAGVKPGEFSQSANGEIYATLLRMARENKPIDSLLLCDELDVSHVGGSAYLADLTTNAIPVESHVLARCKIIRRDARLRRVIDIAEQMQEAARKRGAVPEDIVTDAASKLREVTA